MANVIPYSFRGELFTGTHNFASGGDSFKLALYFVPFDSFHVNFTRVNIIHED